MKISGSKVGQKTVKAVEVLSVVVAVAVLVRRLMLYRPTLE